MVESENSSDNTIRIGVENISEGDINIEVVDKVIPNNGEDILIGVNNHSVTGNNNIKVHDIDFKGCGKARVGAGNYAHGSNNIFIGSLQPTNGSSSCDSEDTPGPPMQPNRPSGFGGPLLSPLLSRKKSLPRVPSGPLMAGGSDGISRSSLPQQSRPVIGPYLPNKARTTPQPLSRSKTMGRGPIRPQPPNGPLPPNPPTQPFSA